VTIIVVVAIAVLYLSRRTSHRLIGRISCSGFRLARLLARGCTALATRIDTRNREVMLALQMEITRRQLEREFQRVAAAVEQDMTKFQHLERSINEHVNVMEEDFERSAQVPPAPPGWVDAVDAIAKLQNETNPEPVGRVLQDIHNSVLDQQREVMREYRWAVNARHKILADLRPLWRGVSKQVATVGRDSRDLLGRAHRIDTQMAAFRELCATRVEVRVESFLARWLIALALSTVAVILAVLNVNLIASPLAHMAFGSGMDSWLTAIAFTFAVMASALVFSEATQVSRLLPLIGGLPQRSRVVMAVLSSVLLLALASGEALLLQANTGASGSEAAWGAASAGFVVPMLLALLSPALEAFLATSRPVLAATAAVLLTMLSVLLRLVGRAWLELGRLTHQLYDLLLFLPLALEQTIERRRRMATAEQSRVPEAAVESDKVRRLQFVKRDTRTAE
ncbi:MAG TPA: hypothetical protein VFM32_03105, partial [Spongiibacteraceae bacterium]|nr:hypothetical protein [Spongiibacteraceae bacterium]